MLGCGISAAGYPAENFEKAAHSKGVFAFGKAGKGRIGFDLYVTDTKEVQTITLLNVENGNETIVFSIPVCGGNKFYPREIKPEAWHRFEIEFDLRYNFSKVFIDGEWLTSVLAKTQQRFVNELRSINSPGAKEAPELKNLNVKGTNPDFKIPLKIVAFGNSTTAYRKTITGVYSQRMPEYFQRDNIPVQIFNEGVGGSHTGRISDNSLHKIRHALDRFDDILARHPDIVTFNFGINDSWVDSDDSTGVSRIPLIKFRENLLYMVGTLKKMNIDVIIMTPSGFGKNIPAWRKKRTDGYALVIRDIAKKEDIPLIDQWKLMSSSNFLKGREIDSFLLPDGIHTNDAWHKVLAEKLSATIISYVKR